MFFNRTCKTRHKTILLIESLELYNNEELRAYYKETLLSAIKVNDEYFLNSFRKELCEFGFHPDFAKKITFSEGRMQNRCYASFDVPKGFPECYWNISKGILASTGELYRFMDLEDK